jgi:hypothetical protein
MDNSKSYFPVIPVIDLTGDDDDVKIKVETPDTPAAVSQESEADEGDEESEPAPAPSHSFITTIFSSANPAVDLLRCPSTTTPPSTPVQHGRAIIENYARATRLQELASNRWQLQKNHIARHNFFREVDLLLRILKSRPHR